MIATHEEYSCSPRYSQCGGVGFDGPTTCCKEEGVRCFVNNAWHSQCLDACPNGWACAEGGSTSAEERREDKPPTRAEASLAGGSTSGRSGTTSSSGLFSVDRLSGLLASGAVAQQSISQFAGKAAQELEQAAHDDPKLRKGLPMFFSAVGAFLALACVTFYRVRRKGGRKRPPRVDFLEMRRLSAEETGLGD